MVRQGIVKKRAIIGDYNGLKQPLLSLFGFLGNKPAITPHSHKPHFRKMNSAYVHQKTWGNG